MFNPNPPSMSKQFFIDINAKHTSHHPVTMRSLSSPSHLLAVLVTVLMDAVFHGIVQHGYSAYLIACDFRSRAPVEDNLLPTISHLVPSELHIDNSKLEEELAA
ncbi:hypothetical protein J6590_064591 [Homalodisca vitripennis]|nr:hypothetical protein J6590_064591 [Homalodisca vitripennis]